MITIAVEVLTCRQSESTAGSRQCRARAHRHHWGHGTGAHCSQDFLQRSQLHNCFLIVSYHFSLSLSLSILPVLISSSLVQQFLPFIEDLKRLDPCSLRSHWCTSSTQTTHDNFCCSWPLSCWLFLDEASSAFLEASSVNQKGLLQCYFIQTSCSLAFLPTECAQRIICSSVYANTL